MTDNFPSHNTLLTIFADKWDRFIKIDNNYLVIKAEPRSRVYCVAVWSEKTGYRKVFVGDWDTAIARFIKLRNAAGFDEDAQSDYNRFFDNFLEAVINAYSHVLGEFRQVNKHY